MQLAKLKYLKYIYAIFFIFYSLPVHAQLSEVFEFTKLPNVIKNEILDYIDPKDENVLVFLDNRQTNFLFTDHLARKIISFKIDRIYQYLSNKFGEYWECDGPDGGTFAFETKKFRLEKLNFFRLLPKFSILYSKSNQEQLSKSIQKYSATLLTENELNCSVIEIFSLSAPLFHNFYYKLITDQASIENNIPCNFLRALLILDKIKISILKKRNIKEPTQTIRGGNFYPIFSTNDCAEISYILNPTKIKNLKCLLHSTLTSWGHPSYM